MQQHDRLLLITKYFAKKDAGIDPAAEVHLNKGLGGPEINLLLLFGN